MREINESNPVIHGKKTFSAEEFNQLIAELPAPEKRDAEMDVREWQQLAQNREIFINDQPLVFSFGYKDDDRAKAKKIKQTIKDALIQAAKKENLTPESISDAHVDLIYKNIGQQTFTNSGTLILPEKIQDYGHLDQNDSKKINITVKLNDQQPEFTVNYKYIGKIKPSSEDAIDFIQGLNEIRGILEDKTALDKKIKALKNSVIPVGMTPIPKVITDICEIALTNPRLAEKRIDEELKKLNPGVISSARYTLSLNNENEAVTETVGFEYKISNTPFDLEIVEYSQHESNLIAFINGTHEAGDDLEKSIEAIEATLNFLAKTQNKEFINHEIEKIISELIKKIKLDPEEYTALFSFKKSVFWQINLLDKDKIIQLQTDIKKQNNPQATPLNEFKNGEQLCAETLSGKIPKEISENFDSDFKAAIPRLHPTIIYANKNTAVTTQELFVAELSNAGLDEAYTTWLKQNLDVNFVMPLALSPKINGNLDFEKAGILFALAEIKTGETTHTTFEVIDNETLNVTINHNFLSTGSKDTTNILSNIFKIQIQYHPFGEEKFTFQLIAVETNINTEELKKIFLKALDSNNKEEAVFIEANYPHLIGQVLLPYYKIQNNEIILNQEIHTIKDINILYLLEKYGSTEEIKKQASKQLDIQIDIQKLFHPKTEITEAVREPSSISSENHIKIHYEEKKRELTTKTLSPTERVQIISLASKYDQDTDTRIKSSYQLYAYSANNVTQAKAFIKNSYGAQNFNFIPNLPNIIVSMLENGSLTLKEAYNLEPQKYNLSQNWKNILLDTMLNKPKTFSEAIKSFAKEPDGEAFCNALQNKALSRTSFWNGATENNRIKTACNLYACVCTRDKLEALTKDKNNSRTRLRELAFAMIAENTITKEQGKELNLGKNWASTVEKFSKNLEAEKNKTPENTAKPKTGFWQSLLSSLFQKPKETARQQQAEKVGQEETADGHIIRVIQGDHDVVTPGKPGLPNLAKRQTDEELMKNLDPMLENVTEATKDIATALQKLDAANDQSAKASTRIKPLLSSSYTEQKGTQIVQMGTATKQEQEQEQETPQHKSG